ncbi:MAG: hypothetical protein EBV10_11675 [Synechococcaceae bacterium WB6_1A_059]|nr:hypothetical protein [Synechococcaceae bacterium WB6_1A_059]
MIDFKKILYCPLDIPKYEQEISIENLPHLYDHVADEEILRTRKLTRREFFILNTWNTIFFKLPTYSVDPSIVKDFTTVQNQGTFEWTVKAQLFFPGLIQWIENYLPFTEIKYCLGIVKAGIVGPHIDIYLPNEFEYYTRVEPCFYKAVISGGPGDDNSLFVMSNVTQDKKYLTYPSETNSFVIGGTTCYHGNDNPVPENKMILYMMGIFDEQRHFELIERSYHKYQDHVILDN